MASNHRWIIGLTTSTGLLGLAVSSGLAIVAHHFVDELSHPHEIIDKARFSIDLPPIVAEPPQALRRSLSFQTSDGTFLRGEFWAQPQAAPTIILCHGYRISRLPLRPVAALEYGYGYNILLFDFRGHGESESVITSGGAAEVRDLEAAIIAARPYARLDDILRRIVHYRLTSESDGWKPSLRQLRRFFPAMTWAIVVASALEFRFRFGHTLFARPDLSFKRWYEKRKDLRQVPILLIHGEADGTIPIRHAHLLAAAAKASGTPLETYFVPQARHCGAYGRDPEQYVSLVRAFASRHLNLE